METVPQRPRWPARGEGCPCADLGPSDSSAREDRRQACPGSRAGSQARLAQAETPAPSLRALPFPIGQESNTSAPRLQTTGTSFPATTAVGVARSLPGHSPPVPALTGPQTAWGTCCSYPAAGGSKGEVTARPGAVWPGSRCLHPQPTGSSEVPKWNGGLWPGLELMEK